MAKKSSTGEVELLVEDYPYAEDGLLIWNALEAWNRDYLVTSPSATDLTEL